jgi:hypothetical protein
MTEGSQIRIRGREKPFCVDFAGSSGFLLNPQSSLFTVMGAGWLVCGATSGEEGRRELRDRKIPGFVKAGEVAELAAIRLGTAA